MRYRDFLYEGRVLNIDTRSPGFPNNGIARFIENPSVTQLIAYAAKHDLRGTSDVSSVYIWDASAVIHHNAQWYLRHESNFYTLGTRPDGTKYEVPNREVKYYFNFYVVNNKNARASKEVREEWLNAKRCDFYMLDEWTYICVIKGVGERLCALNPNYARILAPSKMVPVIPRRGISGLSHEQSEKSTDSEDFPHQ